MFELDGNPIDLATVEGWAKEDNKTLEEYINTYGIKDLREGKTTPTTPGAVVEETAAPDMDSKLESGSSGFTKEGEIILTGTPIDDENWAITSVPLEEVIVTAEEYTKRQREITEKIFSDFGIPEIEKKEEGDIRPISEFEETQRISKAEILERQKTPDKPKTLMQSFANSVGQAMNRFAQIDDYGQYLYHMVLSNKDIAYNVFGEEFGNKVLNHNIVELGKQEAKLKRYASLTKPAFGFTDISKDKSIAENIIYGAGGAVNAIMNVGSSAILSATTAGAGLGIEIIGQTIAEHNRILAESKGINLEQLQKSGQFDLATPLTIGVLRYKLEKLGLDKLSKSIIGSNPSLIKNIVDLSFTTGFNGTQEWVDVGLETINRSLAEGKTQTEAEEEAWKFMTSKEGYESFLQGAFGSSGIVLGARGIRTVANLRNKDDYSSLKKKITKIGDLERAKFKKGLSEESINSISEQQNKLISEIKLDVEKNNKILFSLTDSQIKEINSNADVIQQTNKTARAVNEDKSLDNNTKKEILLGLEQRITEAQTKIFNIRKNAEELTKQTEKVKRAAQYVDNLKIEKFDNEEQINDFLDKQDYLNKYQKNKFKKQSNEYGFIIQDPVTNKQTIIINSNEAAKSAEGINVANHEFMHALLFKALKENPETSQKLAIALEAELNKIDIDQIQNSIYKERLLQYKNDPKINKADAAEEALTLFSDALKSGDIKIQEDIISDSIRSIMQGIGVKTKFNTGEDVINFIRDINKSIDKGTLTKEQIRIAQGFDKLEGQIIDQNLSEELVGDNKEQIQNIVRKESRKISSDKVQEIYESQGAANAFDIIAEFKPIVDKIVNKYRNVPGFEYQLLKDEIETGKRGILDMIMAYTPEKAKGAPLAAYINSLLPKRAIEAANRILSTEFTLDVTEAKGVTDVTTQETIEAVEEKPSQQLKSLRKIMGIGDEIIPTVFNAVQKTFGTKLPDINEKTFKKELEKRYRTELKKPISKLFGKGENYRSFLADNFESIYNALPQSIFNKRLKEFAEPVLDKDGNQLRERTAEGNKIFTKKKISKAEFIKYFLGNNIKRSTQGTRKTAIVEAVAEAFAFDATMEVLSDPKIIEKAEGIAELQGKKLPENFVNKLSDIIDRPIDFKFSKKLSETMGLASNEAFGYTNFNDVNLGRIGLTELSEKMVAKFGIEEWVNIIDPLIARQYKSKKDDRGIDIAVDFTVTEEKFKKYEGIFFRRTKIDGEYRTAQFLTLGRKDYYEVILAKAIGENVKWNGKNLVINNEIIKRPNVPPQQPTSKGKKYPGFSDKKGWDSTMEERINFAISQREGFKKIVNVLTEMYNNSDKTRNDKAKVGMILNSFNSSTDALVRTAAIPGLEMRIDGLKDDEYRYEHTQPAAETLRQIAKLIIGDENAQSFDEIMENFRVAIIPKMYDAIINETSVNGELLKSASPLDKNGNLKKPTKSTLPTRYEAAAENILKAGLAPLKLIDNYSAENVQVKQSKSLNKDFNKILEASTGVKWTETFSPVKAKLLGKGKGKKFFIPYSADDFVGLLYTTLASGKAGDAQMKWYEENLLRPFSRGIQQYEAAKQQALREWVAIKKEAKKNVPGGLNKVNDTGFRNQDAVRLYIWNKQGNDIPGLLKKDLNPNLKVIKNNPKLKEFADRLIALQPEGYPPPSANWLAGDITTDLVGYINGVKRSEFLTEWKDNVDIIFSEKNMDKLRGLYGDLYVEALDNMLHRMRTGTNRYKGADRTTKRFMDWTNNSVGTIMFFNARSAVLQTLSAVNFINFTDNNPINAGLAFANQKQFWNDFTELWSSDFLKQRRSGLQTDVNADEIARAAATAENKAQAVLSYLLKIGFAPTQAADSFAIAMGGASFYRNRIKKYIKEGLSETEAQKKAFTDFQEIAEETQQSARPDRISMQQASPLGRLILAFGNTPMQYARLTKKAALDLINGRGDWKTNISKIAYYSVIQNIIFSALQQGLFALLFSDEEDDKEKERYFKLGNGMADTLLRGIGVYGAAAATVKNMIFEIIKQEKSKRPNYTEVAIQSTSISPPINSKLRKLISAGKTFTYKQSREKVFTEGFSLENPAFLAAGQVLSAGVNLPADRMVLKLDHLKTAMEPETELWQSIALGLGWSEWDLGMIEKETKKILINKPVKIQTGLKKNKIKVGIK